MAAQALDLTAEQEKAVGVETNLLLTACPGSGKTRTLIAKAIKELDGVRGTPRRICCITYTNTAVQEIEHRIRQQMQEGDHLNITVLTIHAFCLQEILRPFAWLLPGFSGQLKVLTRDNPDFKSLADEAASEAGLGPLTEKDYENFEQLSVGSSGKLTGACADHPFMNELAPIFWRRCFASGYVDFCSIMLLSFQIAQDHKLVVSSLSSRYAWILVDEFQDTSELQLCLLRHLFLAGKSRFFLAGDLTQSIYGFSGATPELLQPFACEIGARADLSLSVNFRSSRHVVADAEKLFPRTPAMKAEGEHRDFTYVPKLVKGVKSFDAINRYFIPTLAEHGIPLGKAAVFARTWFSLVPLAKGLREAGHPVVGPGARPYRKARLFAALAEQLCGALVDPQPDTMRRVQRELFNTIEQSIGHAPYSILSFEGRVLVIELLRLAHIVPRSMGAFPWLETMALQTAKILSNYGLVTAQTAKIFSESVEEMKNDMIRRRYDPSALTVDDLGMFASPSKALRLLTYHAAKGREYEAVALLDLRERAFPFYKSSTKAQIDEEKRLLYVGVTRAQKILMYVSEIDNYGNAPSRFLGPGGLNLL